MVPCTRSSPWDTPSWVYDFLHGLLLYPDPEDADPAEVVDVVLGMEPGVRAAAVLGMGLEVPDVDVPGMALEVLAAAGAAVVDVAALVLEAVIDSAHWEVQR